MQEIGHAALAIIPSFDGFQSKLETGSSKAMLAAGDTGGAKFGDAAGKSAGARFTSHIRSAAKIAAVGLAVSGAAAFKFAGDSLQEAREAQKIGAQTAAVIKSTGGAAKVTEKDIGKLTGRLSDMAGIDDELIQSGANVLLTFKNIRNEAGQGNKVFDKATEAALNMSVALDSDLKGASIQVGKALNDPVKGVTALGRAGVQFSEDQKKAIEKMVESGDTLGAQKIILRELDDQFKGSAKAQATEADKLKVAYGNLKEEVGTALIPVMDDLAVFLRKKGIPAARDFFGWIQDDAIPTMKNLYDQTKPARKIIGDLVDVFADLPTSGKIASIAGIVAGGLVVKHKLAGIFDRGGPANPMFVVVTNPTGVPGDGPGGKPGSKAVSLAKGAAKLLPPVLILGGLVYAVNETIVKPAKENATRLEPTRQGFDSTLASIEGVENKAKGYGKTLDLVGSKKVEPLFAVPGLAKGRDGLKEFLRLQEAAGKPITPYIHTADIERAIEVARTLNAVLGARPQVERGEDGGVNYLHGGTGEGGGKGGSGRVAASGVVIDQRGSTIVAHDYDDFVGQTQKKAQAAGLGGRPTP